MVWYSSIYIAPLNGRGQTEACRYTVQQMISNQLTLSTHRPILSIPSVENLCIVPQENYTNAQIRNYYE